MWLLFVLSFAWAKIPINQGRFQVVQVNEFARDQYLIDTDTGMLWRMSCAKKTGSDCVLWVWQRELVEGQNITTEEISKLIKALAKE